jgi:hypothetical protein
MLMVIVFLRVKREKSAVMVVVVTYLKIVAQVVIVVQKIISVVTIYAVLLIKFVPQFQIRLQEQFIEYARFLVVILHALQMKYAVMEPVRLPVLFHRQSSEVGMKILYLVASHGFHVNILATRQKDFTAIVFSGAMKVGMLLMASASITMVVNVDVVL